MSSVFQSGALPRRSAVAGSTGLCPRAALGRWARWLCHLLAAWCTLTLLSAAQAVAASGTPDESAPMCDPDGASVAAKDDIPEVDRGHFEALPCEAQLWIPGWRLDAPELGWHAASIHDTNPSVPPPPPSPPRIRYDAAYEVSVPFPERCEPRAAAFFRSKGLEQRRGHARGLYRPPVLRA